jgi:Holliday junction resolvase RusA-like endonuclease
MPAAAIRSDVDNLAKFVMDSLNGVLYVDDRQVVNLNVMKVLDSEGPCFGATEVEICVLREGDMMV